MADYLESYKRTRAKSLSLARWDGPGPTILNNGLSVPGAQGVMLPSLLTLLALPPSSQSPERANVG